MMYYKKYDVYFHDVMTSCRFEVSTNLLVSAAKRPFAKPRLWRSQECRRDVWIPNKDDDDDDDDGE